MSCTLFGVPFAGTGRLYKVTIYNLGSETTPRLDSKCGDRGRTGPVVSGYFRYAELEKMYFYQASVTDFSRNPPHNGNGNGYSYDYCIFNAAVQQWYVQPTIWDEELEKLVDDPTQEPYPYEDMFIEINDRPQRTTVNYSNHDE